MVQSENMIAAELYLRPVSSVLALFTDSFLFLFLCLMVSPGRIAV